MIVADNSEMCPVEVQVASKAFREQMEWGWGICVSICFQFHYIVAPLVGMNAQIKDLSALSDEKSSQSSSVCRILMRSQCYSCIGLEEYAGLRIENCGTISFTIESSVCLRRCE